MRFQGKSLSNFKMLAAVAAGAVVFSAAQAHATLMLNVYANGNPVAIASVTDGGAGDTDPTANEIVYSSPGTADLSFSVDIAKSNKPGGTTDNLNITSFTARSGTAGVKNLTLVLSDVGFIAPSGPAAFTLQSTVSGTFTSATAGDNVTFRSFADPANVQQTTAVPSGSPTASSLQTFTKALNDLTVESFGGVTSLTPFSPSGPFSMSSVSSFNLSGNASVQFMGGSVVAGVTPEPASLGLLIAGGLTLLGSRRRRV